MTTIPPLGALVRRIEPPVNGLATIAAIKESPDGYTVCIDYAEGGQAWWPLDCLKIVSETTADWTRFKRIALDSDRLNEIIASAYQIVPVAAGALASALLRAEAGDVTDFAAAWSTICRAVNVPPEVVDGFVGVARACSLPAEFIEALQPTPREN